MHAEDPAGEDGDPDAAVGDGGDDDGAPKVLSKKEKEKLKKERERV